MSMNMFAVLGDEGESGAPQRREKGAKASAGAKKEKAPLSGFPGEQPAGREANNNKHAARVPDRQKESHRGGHHARGGHRGGRGGAHADPTRRQFDRHGAPTKHAPNHAHRDGAALGPEGGAELVKQGDATADVVEITAETPVADVPDLDFQEVDPDDDLKTLDEYLASKKMVEDEVQVREVDNSNPDFQKVKPLKREDEEESKEESESQRKAKKASAQRSAQKINLDEFRGGRDADAQIRRPESARGGRGGFRGGRGGFAANGEQPRGDAPARGGRGGFVARGGARGGPRGGARGGFAPRGGRVGNSAPVALNDKNAFPAL